MLWNHNHRPISARCNCLLRVIFVDALFTSASRTHLHIRLDTPSLLFLQIIYTLSIIVFA